MNERIKDLLYEAWRLVDGPASDGQRYVIMDNDEPVNAKFAELIVRECSKVCADVGMRSGGGCTTVGETYLDASKSIRKHFGFDSSGIY